MGHMEKIKLLENIDALKDLLSLPDTLMKVLEAVTSDESTPDNIASIILRDPSLTARILKLANSSYYRRSTPIKTVHQAVMVLGANAVKCIALSVSVFSPPKGQAAEIEMFRQFYFHCLGVAILSRAIATKAGYPSIEEAFIAGLLHDLGKLHVMQRFSPVCLEINTHASKGEDIIDVERKYFDVDHAELGSIIANRWRLPEVLQRTIRRHHHLNDPGSDDLTKIVMLANMIAVVIQAPNLKVMERLSPAIEQISKDLRLDRDFLDSISFLLLEETVKAASNIGIDIGETSELMNRANRELCKAYLLIEGLFKERQELSGKLLDEERTAGMMRSKNIAIATLSHYLNNVATAISGRVQLMQLAIEKNEVVNHTDKFAMSLKVIESSILKLLAVLAELKSLSRFDDQNFYNDSDALNIDERIKVRMQSIDQTYASKPH
jgi:putative nucleotidyltransferase with HDIG domain